jgi:hypothetical protein
MAQSMEEIKEFIKDYLTRYKDETNLEEIKEDYLNSFDENESPSIEPFYAAWNKLREEKVVVIVPGQETNYQLYKKKS